MRRRSWWRVSCEALGPEFDESVLAATAAQAATDWAEGRGTEADEVLEVDVCAETGDSGVLVGVPERFELRATVRWRASPVGPRG